MKTNEEIPTIVGLERLVRHIRMSRHASHTEIVRAFHYLIRLLRERVPDLETDDIVEAFEKGGHDEGN